MLDNLRRSLSPPSVLLALITGWAMPLEDAAVWTAFILSTIVLPPFIPVIVGIAPARSGVTLRSHFRALRAEFGLALVQSGLMVVFLAHQAWLMADAIIRTLVRLTVTRRHLLEWVPAAHAAFGSRPGNSALLPADGRDGRDRCRGDSRGMGLGTGNMAAGRSVRRRLVRLPGGRALGEPVAPVVARRPLAEADAHALRLIARQTWRFFEPSSLRRPHASARQFPGSPEPVVAHRTSPTNIGSTLCRWRARAIWAGSAPSKLLSGSRRRCRPWHRLARYRGHFYNWYDTRDLRPLDPQYVSSVDSGNLAGHLIALANACREWRSSRHDGTAAF